MLFSASVFRDSRKTKIREYSAALALAHAALAHAALAALAHAVLAALADLATLADLTTLADLASFALLLLIRFFTANDTIAIHKHMVI